MLGLHVSVQGWVGQIGLVTELTAVISAFNIILTAAFLLLPIISVEAIIVVEGHGVRIHD
jgi:hypothetical protein